KRGGQFADLFERRANPLTDHTPRALDGIGSRAAADSRAEFIANLFDFGAEPFGAARIVESIPFFKLGTKLAQTVSILGAGPRIERESRAAIVAHNLQAVGTRCILRRRIGGASIDSGDE